MLQEAFNNLFVTLIPAVQECYGDRLVTVALYGSVARGAMRFDSDVDLLIIVEDLPRGRLKRSAEFEKVEQTLFNTFENLRRHGIKTTLSPVLKTPEEVSAGSPLFLDMVDDARLLYDRNHFFAHHLVQFRNRLAKLGAQRIWRGNVWYWDLKPDYQPGEVFEL